jgi:hypothetical protein
MNTLSHNLVKSRRENVPIPSLASVRVFSIDPDMFRCKRKVAKKRPFGQHPVTAMAGALKVHRGLVA